MVPCEISQIITKFKLLNVQRLNEPALAAYMYMYVVGLFLSYKGLGFNNACTQVRL